MGWVEGGVREGVGWSEVGVGWGLGRGVIFDSERKKIIVFW